MQLTARYLVKNKINIILDQTGFNVEYSPVYQQNLNVYKGIDNELQFQLKNADQKPVDVSAYTPIFVAFDDEKKMVIETTGVVLDDGSSATRGTFKVTITENTLLNLNQQYLTYTIYLKDSNDNRILTYANSYFGATGVLYIQDAAFPGPPVTKEVTTFSKVAPDVDEWTSSIINAEPGINGNNALHTVVVYTDGYVGDIIVQGTLENQVGPATGWADISTVAIDNASEPVYINFNGVYSFLRFKVNANPANTITKVFVRN